MWRQMGGSAALRQSAPSRLRILSPLKRRRSQWRSLSKPELRMLMAGLASWEQRSRGSVRARVRRKRLDAVAFYGEMYGALPSNRLWTGKSVGGYATPAHNPRNENMWGVMWREA
jgi:hypothetical protein